jgi:hypothetical protein
MQLKREADYGYEYPIEAMVSGEKIKVRKMKKEEMPDDGITYYCAENSTIYYEGEPHPGNFKIINNLTK